MDGRDVCVVVDGVESRVFAQDILEHALSLDKATFVPIYY